MSFELYVFGYFAITATLLMIEYLLMWLLGTQHYRLLPHLLAITTSWLLNFPLLLLCLAAVEFLNIVSFGPGDSAIGGTIVFLCYGFGMWLMGLIFYQVYGFFTSYSGKTKAFVFTIGSVVGTFVPILLGWRPYELKTPVALLYDFIVIQTTFWGIFFIEYIIHRLFGGRPKNASLPLETDRSS